MIVAVQPVEGHTDDQACWLRAALQDAGIDVMKIRRQTPTGRSYLVWVDRPDAAGRVAASVRDIGTAEEERTGLGRHSGGRTAGTRASRDSLQE